MHRSAPKISWPVAAWVVVCAWLNCAGWVLSALHQLNVAGYTVCFLVGAVAIFLFRKHLLPRWSGFQFQRWRRRFSRAYPAAFLVLACLALAGGVLYPPTNYDGLTYREPRVLHWLAEGRWHWIHTDFQRLNVRACGFEWLSAPLILFTRTDRLVFLINAISFLLLPGLIFSTFTGLGIRPRAAWHWMWLFPSGYCFLLQAGSIGNDAFSAVFALASIVFALHARASRRISDFWLSCLAAALMTGAKSSNMPLLLPWFVAVIPSIPLVWKHVAATLGVGVVGTVCSFLPIAALNVEHCGDWSGQAAEHALFVKTDPLLHITHNSMLIGIHNLVPPVFPATDVWKRLMLKTISQERTRRLGQIFEPSAICLSVPDMQTEESAGLGFGISLLGLLTFIATVLSKRRAIRANPSCAPGFLRAAVLAGAWLSLLPLISVSGSSTPARYLAPQYGLLFPLLLLNQSGDWIRSHRWWRVSGMFVFLMAAALLIISPARPLWPARTVLSKLGERDHGASALVKRAQTVYAVYGKRADAFAPVRNLLPADVMVVGMITADDPETSLWRPFGGRRVCHVLPEDSREDLDHRGITYVLISSEQFRQRFAGPLEQWQAGMHADLVQTLSLALRAGRDATDWYLLKLPPLPPAGTKSL